MCKYAKLNVLELYSFSSFPLVNKPYQSGKVPKLRDEHGFPRVDDIDRSDDKGARARNSIISPIL